MKEQLKEMTALCKTFLNSIQLIEYKQKRLKNDVVSALTSCYSKIEEIKEKLNTQRSAQNTMPPLSTGNSTIS